jgi:hypothetical protein
VALRLYGRGVRAGAATSGRLVDVSPTAAALLGIPPPARATGRPLTELLDDSRTPDRLALDDERARSPWLARVAAARAAQERSAGTWALGRWAAVALLLSLVALAIARAGGRLADLTPALVYAGGWAALFPLVVGRLSLSSAASRDQLVARLVVTGCLALLPSWLLARRRPASRSIRHVTLWATQSALVGAIPWLCAAAAHGFRGSIHLPPAIAIALSVMGPAPPAIACLAGALMAAALPPRSPATPPSRKGVPSSRGRPEPERANCNFPEETGPAATPHHGIRAMRRMARTPLDASRGDPRPARGWTAARYGATLIFRQFDRPLACDTSGQTQAFES